MHDDSPLDAELRALRERRTRELVAPETASPTRPIEVTDATFAQTLRQHPRVVLDVWAPWCGPCRIIAPMLDELAADLAGKVVIGKLNADENPATPVKYGIFGIPTLIVFERGEEVDRIVGVLPKEQLRKRIAG